MKKQKETWKQVPGFPAYDVSDFGNIRSYYKIGKHKEGTHLAPQRTLKLWKNTAGYYSVLLWENGERFNKRVHRIVMLAFVGKCPKWLIVCHNDGNKENNNIDNLRYDTQSANIKDAIRHGTFSSLFTNRNFTDDEITKIRIKCASGISPSAIASEYGTSKKYIQRIARGEKRKLVEGPIKGVDYQKYGKQSTN